MDARVVRVLELLGDVHALVLGGYLLCPADRPGDAFVVRGQDQLRPQGRDQLLALLAHALRHDDAYPVALQPADQRQADARVAGAGLQHDAVRSEEAVPFGPLEHGQRDAVLDAAARVEELRLGVDALPGKPQQRRVADQVQYVVGQHLRLRGRFAGGRYHTVLRPIRSTGRTGALAGHGCTLAA